jgi:hypothetical protein
MKLFQNSSRLGGEQKIKTLQTLVLYSRIRKLLIMNNIDLLCILNREKKCLFSSESFSKWLRHEMLTLELDSHIQAQLVTTHSCPVLYGGIWICTSRGCLFMSVLAVIKLLLQSTAHVLLNDSNCHAWSYNSIVNRDMLLSWPYLPLSA